MPSIAPPGIVDNDSLCTEKGYNTGMQYLHQATYGNLGGMHTLKPQLEMRGNAVYATRYNTTASAAHPLYTVHDNKMYSTEFHPDGKSAHALFEIRGDKVHTTSFHPEHNASQHVFELRPHL